MNYYQTIGSKLLFLIFIVAACKTSKRHAHGNTGSLPRIGFDMRKVRSDYEKEMAVVSRMKITHKDKREKTLKRKLNWQKGYSIQTTEGEKMRIPFSLEEDLFFYDRYGHGTSYTAWTFFIVSKKDKNYDFELVTYIDDIPEDPTKFTPNWSGQIIIENVQGDFKKAYFVDNGITVGEESSQPDYQRTLYQNCRRIEYWSCAYPPCSTPCLLMYTVLMCYSQLPQAKVKASNVYLELASGPFDPDGE